MQLQQQHQLTTSHHNTILYNYYRISNTLFVVVTYYLLIACERAMSQPSPTDFSGTYKITQVLDYDSKQAIALPPESIFTMTLMQKEANSDDTGAIVGTNESATYGMKLKIGNLLFTDVSVSEQSSATTAGVDESSTVNVSIGSVGSTRMLPPPEIYNVERKVKALLPTLETMQLEGTMNLVLKGQAGAIYCETKISEGI